MISEGENLGKRYLGGRVATKEYPGEGEGRDKRLLRATNRPLRQN